MPERQADRLVWVGFGLFWQHNMQTDAGAARVVGALVGGVHNARPAPGKHHETRAGQEFANPVGAVVVNRFGLDAGAPEDADGRSDVCQRFGSMLHL